MGYNQEFASTFLTGFFGGTVLSIHLESWEPKGTSAASCCTSIHTTGGPALLGNMEEFLGSCIYMLFILPPQN